MKTFDPKDKKGSSANYGNSSRREFSNRDDSRKAESNDAASFYKDQRRDKRPRLNNSAGEPAREERRRSFNPNFTRDNRIKEEGSFKKSYHGDERGRNTSREDRFRKEDNFSARSHAAGGFNKRSDERGPSRRDSFGTSSYAEKPPREEGRFSREGEKPYRGGVASNRGGQRRPDRSFDRLERNDRNSFGRDDRPAFRGDNDRSASRNQERGFSRGGAGRYGRSDRNERGAYPAKGGRKGEFKKYDSEHYPRFDAPKQTGAVRLNRFIANSGVCSRREADDLITAGVVSVNGEVVSVLGTKVMPTDEVRFNGEVIHGEKKVYILMNKPKGYVTSLDDPHADKTVMDLLKSACSERVYPVGRLDKNSVGVLLITNDGELTRQLTHPSYQKRKVYQVTIDKPLAEEDMQKLSDGIELEDGLIFADEISCVSTSRKEVGVEIHSGRNRIVRRMFEALGYSVQKLDRVYFAGLTKKSLKRGGWRFLTPREVSMLKSGEYQ